MLEVGLLDLTLITQKRKIKSKSNGKSKSRYQSTVRKLTYKTVESVYLVNTFAV